VVDTRRDPDGAHALRVVDTRRDPDGAHALRVFWSEVALERLRGRSEGLFSHQRACGIGARSAAHP
jgi:hypothetical protein